jgi:hypothetical protein
LHTYVEIEKARVLLLADQQACPQQTGENENKINFGDLAACFQAAIRPLKFRVSLSNLSKSYR